MLLGREALLDLEESRLAPYAQKAKASRGRAYPEAESPYRTPYQRDRDRILHTTAFRRLAYKTQVFTLFLEDPPAGDYFRTRLTHTLEVAQVARTLARALGLNEDLTEAIALAHDLGHPPFGHTGEAVLDGLLEEDGGFEHNAQAFRILTQLERRYPAFPGLNLSYEVLEGIATHESKGAEKAQGELRRLFPGAEPGQGTLEAQVVDLSDAIAYAAHDLDDGLRSGLLKPGSLLDLPFLKEVAQDLGLDLPRLDELGRRRLIREILGRLIVDALEATHPRVAGLKDPEAVRLAPGPLAGLSPGMARAHRELKAFLRENLYHHPRVERVRKRAEGVLARLFQAYLDRPSLLPQEVQARAQEEGLPRAVADYLAGMTDRFALRAYRRLGKGTG